MKVVPKLTIALVAGTCVLLAINGWFRVHRETSAFEAEQLRRHVMIGRAVGAAVRASWKTEGEAAAMTTLAAALPNDETLEAHWLAPAGASSEPRTAIDRTRKPPSWVTFVPITVNDRHVGDIEIVEPATADEITTHRVMLETLKMTAALVALSALLAFVLGHWLVGRPIRILETKARRIGRGDFDHPVELTSRDELAELGTEMNAMCDRLVGTLEQLRHADRLATVGKLASGVAHELGTPLNVVTARAEMMVSPTMRPEDVGDYARAITKAADRMTTIIRHLMQFARRTPVQRKLSDPANLTRDALDLVKPLARKKNVALDLDAEACARVEVDAGQLQQVVTNLVINALHASRDGGRIVVRVDEQAETPPADIGGARRPCVRLVVEDEGTGIAPENLSRIFEPFFTTKDVGEGTGLGLAVSYGIVRDHGGWMTVDSTIGKGSTFSVFLPRDVPREVAA